MTPIKRFHFTVEGPARVAVTQVIASFTGQPYEEVRNTIVAKGYYDCPADRASDFVDKMRAAGVATSNTPAADYAAERDRCLSIVHRIGARVFNAVSTILEKV